jgi:hypothetical protein
MIARSNTPQPFRVLAIKAWRHMQLVMVAMLSALGAGVAQAQTATPATAVPVALSIDSNALLTQVNMWTASLDDVIFIGLAIAVAIALLTFIGSRIIEAFQDAAK